MFYERFYIKLKLTMYKEFTAYDGDGYQPPLYLETSREKVKINN